MTERHNPFDETASDTKSQIMQATFKTLQQHGYGGLSMSRIADRADISKSSVYHHYDNKDALMYDFLNNTISVLEDDFTRMEIEDAVTALEVLLIQGIRGRLPGQTTSGDIIDEISSDDQNAKQVDQSLIDIRAQAIHDSDYRTRITSLDQTLTAHIKSIIQSGINQGVFRDVDTDAVAETLLTIVLGAILRRTTAEAPPMDEVHHIVDDFLQRTLIKQD